MEDVVKKVIEKLETWFGKTKIDEACEAWNTFKEIKRNDSEKIDEFLLRFDTAESKLRNTVVQLPNLILPLQLIDSVDVSADQKRNILANVKNVEDPDTILDDMKSSLRLLKGSLVEDHNRASGNSEEEVNFVRNASRSRSKSRSNFNSRSFDSRSNPIDERGRSRDRYNGERGKSSDRYNGDRGRSRERRNSNQNGRYKGSHSRPRSYSRSGFRRDERNSRSRERGRDYGDRYESINLIFKGNGDDEKIVDEESDLMILDCGTTKTVSGKQWMNTYLESLPKEDLEHIIRSPEERYFRFGDSARYRSKEEIILPLKLGKLETFIYVSLVDAPIPLLLGRQDFKRLGFTLDFEEETVFISRTSEMFPLEVNIQGHLALPIKDAEILEDHIFLISDCDDNEKRKKIKKIHKVLAHPLPEILKKFFKNSTENDKEVLKIVDQISKACDVCKRFRKTPSRPKVALPVSSDFNQCIALDLKERRKNKEYILYCICTNEGHNY